MQIAVAGVEDIGDPEPVFPLTSRCIRRFEHAAAASLRGIVPSMQ